MATVPSGTRFIGIATDVNLVEKKSALLNKETQPYTIEDIANYVAAIKPYKSYLAYLSYGALTGFVVIPTVVYNDLDVTPSWAIDGGGSPIFNATATGEFRTNRTVMFTDTQVKGQSSFVSANKNINTNIISFQLTDSNGDLFFSPFSNLLVEIRVY